MKLIILLFVWFGLTHGAMAGPKSVVISLPVVSMGGEAAGKIEYNISGMGGIGLEFFFVRDYELYSDDEINEFNGDSITTNGSGVALTYSSYTNGSTLSGGFWTLGVGYRQIEADWKRTPTKDFSPSGVALDGDGKFRHRLNAVGITGHARVGYRYVPASWPLAIGAYVGIRHFQNQFSDREEDDSVETPLEDQESLSRRVMSSLEPGIEIGMAF